MKRCLALLVVCAVLIGGIGCGVVNNVRNELLQKLIVSGLEGTDANLISCAVTDTLVTMKLLAPEGSAEVAARYDFDDDCRATWDSAAGQFAELSATVTEQLRENKFPQEVEIWVINDQKPEEEDFALLICRGGKIVYSVINDPSRKGGLMNPLDNDELRRYLEDLLAGGEMAPLSCTVTDDRVVIKMPAPDGVAGGLSLYGESDTVKTRWDAAAEKLIQLSELMANETKVKGKGQSAAVWLVSDLDRDVVLLICENGAVTYNVVDDVEAGQ